MDGRSCLIGGTGNRANARGARRSPYEPGSYEARPTLRMARLQTFSRRGQRGSRCQSNAPLLMLKPQEWGSAREAPDSGSIWRRSWGRAVPGDRPGDGASRWRSALSGCVVATRLGARRSGCRRATAARRLTTSGAAALRRLQRRHLRHGSAVPGDELGAAPRLRRRRSPVGLPEVLSVAVRYLLQANAGEPPHRMASLCRPRAAWLFR